MRARRTKKGFKKTGSEDGILVGSVVRILVVGTLVGTLVVGTLVGSVVGTMKIALELVKPFFSRRDHLVDDPFVLLIQLNV